MIQFEPVLNFGTLIAIAAVVFTGIGFYYITKSDMANLKMNVVEIKNDIRILNKVITEVAVQDKRLDIQAEQLNQIRQELIDLRHGRGFVQD